ncbi:MAG: hypothetical protein Fur0041_05060 [Bacteroidia bacterium]
MKFRERFNYNPQTDELGRGGFATVYKAVDTTTGQVVALKIFNRDGNKRYSVKEEVTKVIALKHPNIVRYMEFIQEESINFQGESEMIEIAVIEFIEAGDLKGLIKSSPDYIKDIAPKILSDILKGLEYLHQNRIIHRDLKPDNILLYVINGQVVAKISDFGISKKSECVKKCIRRDSGNP